MVDGIARLLISKLKINISNITNDLLISGGSQSKPSLVYNNNGTYTVGSGTYRMYDNPDKYGIIREYIVDGNTFSITDGIVQYLVVDYNNGIPVISSITDSSLINHSNVLGIYTIVLKDSYFHYVDWGNYTRGSINKILQRLVDTNRFGRANGLNIGELATRKIIISSGYIWNCIQKIFVDSCDSSTDYAFLEATNGSGTFVSSSITQYNNTQYDTGTGLATLTDGHYAVNWIYRMINGHKMMYIFLGNGDYTLSEAQLASPPANVPIMFSTNAVLVGKITVLKGATSAQAIESAWDIDYDVSSVTNHESLTGLQGGEAIGGHFYHSDQPINTTSTVSFANLSGTNTGDETEATIKSKISYLEIAKGGTSAQTVDGARTNFGITPNRNLFRNGTFLINQRNSTTVTTNGAYTVDGWFLNTDGGSFVNGIGKITLSSTGTYATLGQFISTDVRSFALNQTITATLNIESATATQVKLLTTGGTILKTWDIVAGTTKYTHTFTYTSGTNSMFFGIYGSGISVVITGLKLEIGSVSTPAAYEFYGSRLTDSSRYYEVLPDIILVNSTGGAKVAQQLYPMYFFRIPMQSVPSVTLSYQINSEAIVNNYVPTNITQYGFWDTGVSIPNQGTVRIFNIIATAELTS